ncbi:MAG: hypothetical protein HYT35_00810 [Candidatus Staskawiczbacteria bacterium]|nr:hypothetical protein [Candidatus Staskawiczbacteria bacterium]
MTLENIDFETCAERYGHLFPPGTRIEGSNPEMIYFPDHDERYAHTPPGMRWNYPDAVFTLMGRLIKRERNFANLNSEEWRRYTPTERRLAAKDIPVSKAMDEYH